MIGFQPDQYTVDEDAGSVNFTVVVIDGELGFDVVVEFFTEDGSAQGMYIRKKSEAYFCSCIENKSGIYAGLCLMHGAAFEVLYTCRHYRKSMVKLLELLNILVMSLIAATKPEMLHELFYTFPCVIILSEAHCEPS